MKTDKLPWYETMVEPRKEWNVRERFQRSDEEVKQLKDKAEEKRQMKRNKRIAQFN